MLPESSSNRGGFWVRLAAISIDTLIVYSTCSFAFWLLLKIGVYVPFELSAIVAGAAFVVIATTWHGRTIGKSLCGLRVGTKSEVQLGLLRTLIRETVGKFVSSALLFGGFLWVAWTRGKRAWHDLIAGTVVIRQRSRKTQWIAVCSIVTLIAALLLYVGELVWFARVYASMATRPPYALEYKSRNATELVAVQGDLLASGDFP